MDFFVKVKRSDFINTDNALDFKHICSKQKSMTDHQNIRNILNFREKFSGKKTKIYLQPENGHSCPCKVISKVRNNL